MKTTTELLNLYKSIKPEEAPKNADTKTLLKFYEEQETKKLYKIIYKNNFRIALFYEVLPVVLEVLKKYEGKPFGERTKEKIYDELYSLTNCYISIYSHEIKITHRDDALFYGDSVTAWTYYKKDGTQPSVIDNNNKICVLSVDDFSLAYIKNNYIDEEKISEYIETIKAEKLRLYEMQEAYKKACRDFNDNLVNGIPEVYETKHNYANILAESF